MVTLRYRIVGETPGFRFQAALERFAGPELDNIHKQVAIRLTTRAKAILEGNLERPWESGSRTGSRLTGTLTGKHGRKAAIRSQILNRGAGARQARGVGFPDVAELDRRAAHWRGIEYGWPSMTMPPGVFLNNGTPQALGPRKAGDRFFTYGEFARRGRALGEEGFRRVRGHAGPLGPVSSRRIRFERSRRTAAEGGRGTFFRGGPVEGIQGKGFLQQAWDEVVGPDGANIASRYRKALTEIFGEFRTG